MTIGVSKEDQVVCKADGCTRRFDDERSMNIHYQMTHDGSLAKNEVECKICGDTFQQRNWEDREHCSNECAGQSLRNRITTDCAWCGETFEQRPSDDRTYCGKSCAAKARMS